MTCFRSVAKSPGNFTYLFTPKSVIQSLAASFTDVPAVLNSLKIPSLNTTRVLHGNDTLPPGMDASEIGVGGETRPLIVHVPFFFFDADQGTFYDNGVSHSFFSAPLWQGRCSLHPTRLNTSMQHSIRRGRRQRMGIPRACPHSTQHDLYTQRDVSGTQCTKYSRRCGEPNVRRV